MRRLTTWVTLLLLLAAGACGQEAEPIRYDSTVTTGLPTTRRPTTSGPAAPPGLLLQIRTGGSYWDSFQRRFATVPSLTLYADRVVIRLGAQTAVYPGPALPPLLTGKISQEAVKSAISGAKDAGLNGDPDVGKPTVTDHATTMFTFVDGGRTHRVGAYALGQATHGLSTAQQEVRGRLLHLRRHLDELTSSAATDPYRASVVSVLVRPTTGPQASGPPDPSGGEADWPLGPLATGGEPELGGRCLGFSGQEAERVLAAADTARSNTQWRSVGTTWSMAFRPELPGQAACQPIPT